MDIDLANRQEFKRSHLLVPHGAQYKTLLPVITESHNHCRPLVDLNTGSLTPWKWQATYASRMLSSTAAPGDSLMFCDKKLAELAEQGFHIPTYRERERERKREI